jgi:hypothetical protein
VDAFIVRLAVAAAGGAELVVDHAVDRDLACRYEVTKPNLIFLSASPPSLPR